MRAISFSFPSNKKHTPSMGPMPKPFPSLTRFRSSLSCSQMLFSSPARSWVEGCLVQPTAYAYQRDARKEAVGRVQSLARTCGRLYLEPVLQMGGSVSGRHFHPFAKRVYALAKHVAILSRHWFKPSLDGCVRTEGTDINKA